MNNLIKYAALGAITVLAACVDPGAPVDMGAPDASAPCFDGPCCEGGVVSPQGTVCESSTIEVTGCRGDVDACGYTTHQRVRILQLVCDGVTPDQCTLEGPEATAGYQCNLVGGDRCDPETPGCAPRVCEL